jgi:hypothetical protein
MGDLLACNGKKAGNRDRLDWRFSADGLDERYVANMFTS